MTAVSELMPVLYHLHWTLCALGFGSLRACWTQLLEDNSWAGFDNEPGVE